MITYNSLQGAPRRWLPPAASQPCTSHGRALEKITESQLATGWIGYPIFCSNFEETRGRTICCRFFFSTNSFKSYIERKITSTCNVFLSSHVFLSSLCFPNAVCPHFLTNHSTKASLLMVEGLLICLESIHVSQNKFPSVFYIQWVNYLIWSLEITSGRSAQRHNFRCSSGFASFCRSIIQYFSVICVQNNPSHFCFRLYLHCYFYRATYKFLGAPSVVVVCSNNLQVCKWAV